MSTDARDRRTHDLPTALTTFIGREREIQEVSNLLHREEVRLLTLTGSGGIGKTRLALQVASRLKDDYPDGVAFVDLSPVSDIDSVLSTVEQVLGIAESDNQSIIGHLVAALQEKTVLLTLDNFEHVLGAAPSVAELLRSCPTLKVLVASRAPLEVSGEHQFAVPPLTLPDQMWQPSAQDLSGYEATKLFVARARALKSDFVPTDEDAEAIAKICRRLDGLPLAIELAAGWVKTLTPPALLCRLKPRLPLLTDGARDAPDRLRTMENAIAWSYDLLDPAEQALFRSVAVFAGGFTFEAVKSIIDWAEDRDVEGLKLLRSLVDKSLLRLSGMTADETRYAMLETIRDFGLDLLSNHDEMRSTRLHHAVHYGRLMLELADESKPEVDAKAHQVFNAEFANIGLALDWFLEQELLGVAAEFLQTMTGFWLPSGRIREGRIWLDRVLTVSENLKPGLRIWLLLDAAQLAGAQDDLKKKMSCCAEALDTLEAEIGEDGALLQEEELDLVATFVVVSVLTLGRFEGNDLRRAIRIGEHTLEVCRRLPAGRPESVKALLAHIFALVALLQQVGDYERANALLREALSIAQDIGDAWGSGDALWRLGDLAQLEGDDRQALSLYREALPFRRQSRDDHGLAIDLTHIAALMTDLGEHEAAVLPLDEALILGQKLGDPSALFFVRMELARIAEAQIDQQGAIAHYESAVEHFRRFGELSGEAKILGLLAGAYHRIGDDDQALANYGKQFTVSEEAQFGLGAAMALRGMALIYFTKGNHREARDLSERALSLANEQGDAKGKSQALRTLADVSRDQGEIELALALYWESIVACLATDEMQEMGSDCTTLSNLELAKEVGLGCIRLSNLELANGEIERATRVLGMLVALCESTALVLDASTEDDFANLLNTVREGLGRRALDPLFQEGRALLDLARADAVSNKTYKAIIADFEKPVQLPKRQMPHGLSPRELEVLRLLTQGKTDQEIADALFISHSTVDTHNRSIFRKLDVRNRTEAATFARQLDLT